MFAIADNVLSGEGGVATYAFMMGLAVFSYIARSVIEKQGVNRRKSSTAAYGKSSVINKRFTAGLVMIVLSRAVYLLVPSGMAQWGGLFSCLTGMGGLYCIITFIPGEVDYGVGGGAYLDTIRGANRIIQAAGVAIGLIMGGILFSLLWHNTATNIVVASVCSFSIFAPVGFLAGALWERKAPARARTLVFGSSMAMITVGTILMGLAVVGIRGGGPFWEKVMFLCDTGGIFLLLVTPAAVSSAAAGMGGSDVIPFRGDIQGGEGYPGHPMRPPVDMERKIVLSDDFEKLYQQVMKESARESGAEFVILRTLKSGDEVYEVKAGHGLEDMDAIPVSRYSVKEEVFSRICGESSRAGSGYAVDAKVLQQQERAFIPSAFDGRNGVVVIMPVEHQGMVKAFLTAGFFCHVPDDGLLNVFEYYSMKVLQIFQREKMENSLMDKERVLSVRNEELTSVNRLKSNFLSIVSHELRTPLTTLMAYIETMLNNLKSIEPGTIRDFLNVMNEESERLIGLVDNILSYSNMETGYIKVEKSRCNLNELIEEARNELNNHFIAGEINLELKMPRKPVTMDADRKLILQLIHNLLNNALKFTPRGGKITIGLEEEASSVRITVQDTGRGIPEDQLDKIFDRFHQADASDTREYGGSGLGLAICKNIVSWHEGKIWVENVKEAGAKFVVLLPVKDVVIRKLPEDGFMGPIRFERDRYLTLVVEMLAEFMQARKASIMLLEPEQDILRIVAAKGIDPEFVQNTRLEVGDRIAGAVAQEGRALLVSDIENDRDLGMANNSEFYWTKSFISVPLKEGDRVAGVLNVSDRIEDTKFTSVDMDLMKSLAPVIMGMLQKLFAFQKVSSNFERLKGAMNSILDVREEWGARKLSILTLLAVTVGERLNLDEHSLTALRLGMSMYDLGMMKVPRSIRAKKEKLSENEWEKLKQHTDIGYALASPMGLEQRIMRIIRNHHENFDGSGYPNGLKGYEIPLEARIINVIDSFRALVSEGPYRRCYSIDEAKNEIIKGIGKKFDPRVVSAFIKSLDEIEDIEFICKSTGRGEEGKGESADAEEEINEHKQQSESIKEGVT